METYEFLWKTLLGVAIAVVSAWLTANFALRRFYSERWWDRKVETYTKIIDAAHDVKKYSEVMLEVERGTRDIGEERYEQLQASRRQAEDLLTRQLDVGALVISQAAVSQLERLAGGFTAARSKATTVLYLEGVLQAVAEFLAEFRVLARKDLRR